MKLLFAPRFEEFLSGKGDLDVKELDRRVREIKVLEMDGVQKVLDTLEDEARERLIADFSTPVIHTTVRYLLGLDGDFIGLYKVESRGDEITFQMYNGIIPGYTNPFNNKPEITLAFSPPYSGLKSDRVDKHESIPFP